MSFQELYTETNQDSMFQDMNLHDINLFQNFEWQQKLHNTLTGQPGLLGYEKPSLYSNQMPSGTYFSTAPGYSSDLAQYNNFIVDYHQPGAGDDFLNSISTFECPTTPQASSPLTCLNISTPGSLLNPPRSVLPTERTPSARGSTQENGLKNATKSCAYTYNPLELAPASWDIFEYNSFGELELDRKYSTQELYRYLYSNPQHQVGETCNPKLGGFTLWIQRTPHDSTAGYGHPQAGLCRFKTCEHNNVIKAGDIRVAFDEMTKVVLNLDPKHNAGYVHLSCLEKKMDFPKLCKDLDVRPEDRVLPLEGAQKNLMILQDRTELDHVQRFIDFCNVNGRAPLSYPGLGTLNDEISRFRRRKMKGPAISQWQRWGVEWDNVNKAKKQHAKDLAKAKKDGVRAKKETAKKRACEE